MVKIMFYLIRKIVISLILLFGFNVFLSSFNILIPINILSVLLITFLDTPGILGLVVLYIIAF